MNYDHIFDSSKSGETEFKINHKNNEMLTVLFKEENIVLKADVHGNAVFESLDGTQLKKDKAQSDRLFSKLYCSVKDKTLTVRFPVTKTVDHYPNCDGEYDRYSEIIVDNIYITCPVGK